MARFLMFQGTASSAGKSVIAAGMIRLLRNKGLKVAPFKAQNMSLNSGVTLKGEEMGRAQILQAQAAGVEPDARMNPILLKPQGGNAIQVIVRGKVWKTCSSFEYYQYVEDLWQVVKESLSSLAQEFDFVVMEGAGSPAEINLRHKDLVNMRVAKYCNAPVILIGDIDRGGVFASLYGTWALFEEEERKLLQGFLINKFRGERRILEPALQEIEKLTGVPVLGVLPYLKLHLDEEDSLSKHLEGGERQVVGDVLRVGVIRLPHIANYTDFQPLEREPYVKLSYINSAKELAGLDLLIIPGTKNTFSDLAWLVEQGFAEAIEGFLKAGGLVMGICGGFQMLGERLVDPWGLESPKGTVSGLGVLAMETYFAQEKVLHQVEGYLADDQSARFAGYEIHMGRTHFKKAYPPFLVIDKLLGQSVQHFEGVCVDKRIFGTYVHGIFDRASFRKRFFDCLKQQKGLPVLDMDIKAAASWEDIREQELDKLSIVLEANLDPNFLSRLLAGQ
jgi:adenosylcobyric acid synthase